MRIKGEIEDSIVRADLLIMQTNEKMYLCDNEKDKDFYRTILAKSYKTRAELQDKLEDVKKDIAR